MPRATCRCGQTLTVPADGSERIVCPSCGANVRIRRSNSHTTEDGGFIRFDCPCGRRLKVGSSGGGAKPTHGKCPDCGRVVPVPVTGQAPRDPESPTEEISTEDASRIAEWSKRHLEEQARRTSSNDAPRDATPVRSEAGLRVCPGCGRPVHLGASVCRDCGSAVPKR